MEKKVVSLLGGSCFLVLAGIVLFLWSLFNSGAGPMAGTLPILLILVGAVGLNVGWVLHDVVERLMRLEQGREEGAPSAEARGAEPGAATGRDGI
jgi:hypothetical protein